MIHGGRRSFGSWSCTRTSSLSGRDDLDLAFAAQGGRYAAVLRCAVFAVRMLAAMLIAGWLSGDALALNLLPPVSLSPATPLTFAAQQVGTVSTAQTAILTNNTSVELLSISRIAISGANAADFAQTNSCGSSLAAGRSCTISVTFKPSLAGIRTATLTVIDAAGMQTITLNGTGIPGQLPVSGPACPMGAVCSQPPVSGTACPAGALCPQAPVGVPSPSTGLSPVLVPLVNEQPGIGSMFPNQWVQGSSYSVTVNGKGFVKDMEIGLGAGVQIKGKVKVLTSSLAQMDVEVFGSAAPGQRLAQFRTDARRPWLTTQAIAWVMPLARKYVGMMPTPKIDLLVDLHKNLKKGVITRELPLARKVYDQGKKKFETAPALRDDLVFRWREQNPGTADFFELRILTLGGDVLIRKRIERTRLPLLSGGVVMLAPPRFYQPDSAFFNELNTKRQRTVPADQDKAQTRQEMKKEGMGKAVSLVGLSPEILASLSLWPGNADLLWEVAGYRIYQSNGVAKNVQGDGKQGKSETFEEEVEISDRGPLQQTDGANGFGACPLDGKTSLRVENMDNSKGQTSMSGVNHPFEQWIISGNIDLSRSPYASKPYEYQDPDAKSGFQQSGWGTDWIQSGTGQGLGSSWQLNSETGIVNNVKEHQFDNLFVDWGDGTVQPLSLKANGSAFNQEFEKMKLPDAQAYHPGSPGFYTHRYEDSGQFTIRVYQLSEKDAQKVNTGDLGDAYDGHGGNLYFALRGLAGGSAELPKEIAGRAYQLYCHTVNLEPIMDPDANGPLQLKSVEIVRFGAKEKAVNQSHGQAKASGKVVLSAKVLALAAKTPAGEGVDASCSACNKAFTAQALLKYVGSGDIEAIWKVKMKGQDAVQSFPDTGSGHVPASPSRTGDPAKWREPALGSYEFKSPALPVDPAEVYEVTVEVQAKPDPPRLISANVLSGIIRMGSVTGGIALDAALSGSGGNKPLKVGVLRPYPEGNKAAPPVIYVDSKSLPNLSGAVGDLAKSRQLTSAILTGIKSGPPLFVQSAPKKYKVLPSDAGKPCMFNFIGQDGDKFPVYLDQDKLQQSAGGVYSGSGTLGARLTTNNSSASDLPLEVGFQNWKVDGQGNVAPGTKLSLSPGQEIHPRGLTGFLTKVDGVSGQKMDATLDVKVADSFLRKQGKTEPSGWVVTGGLRNSGDWTQGNALSLGGETALGWSGFYIESDNVVLDLSHSQGKAPEGKCQEGASGTGWTGVSFGNAKIKLNTADLVTVKVPAAGWGVTGWICGELNVSNSPTLSNLPLGKGKVSFNSISLTAEPKGAFTANYNMDVQVPWLDASLHSDNITLQSSNRQEGRFEFAGLKPDADVERDFGPIHMRVPKGSFRFGKDPAGYRVIADPEMSFKSEGKPFTNAPVTVAGMRFGMNGRAFFDPSGAPGRSIPLGGIGQLGKTTLDLTSLRLTGGANGDDRLVAAFIGQTRLSQALPAADAQVNYKISGDSYAGSGPYTGPFKVQAAFPDGNPSINAAISPVYAPGSNNDTRYLGTVDLSMFGGSPVKAEFLLGFQGNNDYWLTRATIPLGDGGVTLIPPFMNLYQLRGGLGYHMALDSFKNPGSLENARPDTSQSVLFMAGMRVGSPDQFTYTLDGDLAVSPSSGARMDYRAWLLKSEQTGSGDFQGYFQYAGGNLDGRLWGHLSLLENDAIYFDLGNSESNAAVDLHFGGGWYINAGKKTGPRIKAHVLIADADAYLMLGSEAGLATGASLNLYLGVGDSSVASAYVKGWMDMGLQITPQPHVAGDFEAGAEAGVCAVGICESMGVTATVHAEAMPVKARAHATVKLPWPAPDVSFDVNL